MRARQLRTGARVLLLTGLVVAVACDRVLPYRATPAPQVADAAAEAGVPDGPLPGGDGSGTDGRVDAPTDITIDTAGDTSVDTSGIPDATVDLFAPDSTVDALAPDSTVDALALDSTVDTTPPADATVDGALPQGACSSAAVEIAPWATSSMVICQSSVLSVTQCTAEDLCAVTEGWTLCSASTYRARGGATSGYSTDTFAWIAGCIRSGGSPKAPSDAACGCSGSSTNITPTAWYCAMPGTDYFLLAAKEVGLVTHSSCMRVGINDPAHEGYWRPRATTSSTDAAVCCYTK